MSIPKKSKNKQIFIYRVINDWVRYDRVRCDWVRNDRVRNDQVRSDQLPFITQFNAQGLGNFFFLVPFP